MAIIRNQISEMIDQQFMNDVDIGLSASNKHLSSRYFYDEIGDEIFVEIMNMPEYYLTDCEMDIFQNQTQEIIDALELTPYAPFQIIELGAGDGTKTKELLRELIHQSFVFEYTPIDISQHALDELEENLKKDLPTLRVLPIRGEYFDSLASFKDTNIPKVVLFLGSNMGNLEDKEATDFLAQLSRSLHTDDKLLLGLDLIKPKEIVEPAYNDSAGITPRFIKNLLHRINNELGANFDVDQFDHELEYTQDEGIARSYLVSKIDQKVFIESLGKEYNFTKGERIHTEISRKYNDEILEKILFPTRFFLQGKLMDSKAYFADYILNRI